MNSTESLRSLVQTELDVRFDCGYMKPISQITLADKGNLINTFWLHHVFFIPHAELLQLRMGFIETLQMEHLVSLHPDEMLSLLIATPAFDVSPGYLQDTFIINFSEHGNNNRTAEEALVLNWNDYVTNCSEGNDVSLDKVLQFFTGSSKLPAAGFHTTPTINFTDDTCLPRASTCDLSITFPRKYGFLTFEEFKEKMDFCILNSYGFGMP